MDRRKRQVRSIDQTTNPRCLPDEGDSVGLEGPASTRYRGRQRDGGSTVPMRVRSVGGLVITLDVMDSTVPRPVSS